MGDSKIAEGTEHFGVLGESACLFLAVDELAIHLDVKNSAAAGDHLDLNLELTLDSVRQTDGLGLVVSLHAVFDGNMHIGTSLIEDDYTSVFRILLQRGAALGRITTISSASIHVKCRQPRSPKPDS